jgi:putative acetyltransferase
LIYVRRETAGDYDCIRRVVVEAFSGSDHGHNGEADLVDDLRAEPEDRLSLVACLDDEIVGHVMFTAVAIRTAQMVTRGMGMAPLSVTPQHQNRGVGSTLVTNGLGQLFDRGCHFVVVLGHPEYYQRFGFRPASQFGVAHGFVGIRQEIFFILPVPSDTLAEVTEGDVYYHAAFGPQHNS